MLAHNIADMMAWSRARTLEGAELVMMRTTLRAFLLLRGVRGVDGVQWLGQDTW